MDTEKRTITLPVTKRRITEDEAKEKGIDASREVGNQTETDPGPNCGTWYMVWYESYHAWFSCRICYAGYPTQFPYEECIGMPV